MQSAKCKKNGNAHTGPHRVEMAGWISLAPFERHLNMEILEAGGGRAVLCMPFVKDLAQGGGLMHGGALVSLADTAVVMAIKSIVAPGAHFATASMETKFLYPVKSGVVTARAEVVRRDGRTIDGEATVCNDSERPVMTFSCVFKIAKQRD